jgi:hypothetical protein
VPTNLAKLAESLVELECLLAVADDGMGPRTRIRTGRTCRALLTVKHATLLMRVVKVDGGMCGRAVLPGVGRDRDAGLTSGCNLRVGNCLWPRARCVLVQRCRRGWYIALRNTYSRTGGQLGNSDGITVLADPRPFVWDIGRLSGVLQPDRHSATIPPSFT